MNICMLFSKIELTISPQKAARRTDGSLKEYTINCPFARGLAGVYITVCPGSSDPPEKIFGIFSSANEVYTIYKLLRYFRLNIIRLQS